MFCTGNGTKPTVVCTETYISVLHESDDTSGCTHNVWDIQINRSVDLQRTFKPRSRSLQHIPYKGKQWLNPSHRKHVLHRTIVCVYFNFQPFRLLASKTGVYSNSVPLCWFFFIGKIPWPGYHYPNVIFFFLTTLN